MDYSTLKKKEAAALALAGSYRMQAEAAQAAEVKRAGIKAWQGYSFDSSSGLTPAFAEFSRVMRLHLKKSLSPEFELVSYSRGHFYFSAFIKNKTTGKLAYISASDVRFSPDSWLSKLLIRTAQHDKDYTGGANDWASLAGLKERALFLTR